MLTKEELKLLLERKQYSEILQKYADNHLVKDYLGFLFLETKEYALAERFFAENKMSFQQGFCKLLTGDKSSARQIWYSAEDNPAISWGKVVLGILDQKLEAIPSFLQVRNFAEMTLHYFFKSNQVEFVYKLVSAKEFLADCNIESYKYIGRVLMDNNYEDLAFDYLKKAISEIPSDCEAHFQLGELYLLRDDSKSALECFKRILDYNPHHSPAKKKISEIENSY